LEVPWELEIGRWTFSFARLIDSRANEC
jgi:hypothetical protein